MPMTLFAERFPDPGMRETRSVTVTGNKDLPDGEYGFVEMYCNEPGCDCRRVMMTVLERKTGWSRVLATISYGWEDADFYRDWDPHGDPRQMQGPSLDPLAPQSKHSRALLELFGLLLQSPDYVERLKRHYAMFRESVDGGRDRVAHRPRSTPKRGRGSRRGRPRAH